jgi:hypothetical protein
VEGNRSSSIPGTEATIRMSSPTQRTLAALRKSGFVAGVVEHHLPFPPPYGTKQDYLGIIDIIAVRAGQKVLAIQTTSGTSNGNARVEKALAEPRLRVWLESGHARFEIWVWSKWGGKGKRKCWALVRKIFTLDARMESIQVSQWTQPEKPSA